MYKICFLGVLIISISASDPENTLIAGVNSDSTRHQAVIHNVFASAYYCVYNTEIDGTQTVTKDISNTRLTLKASFLFGGRGVAMQGTGRSATDGDYIKYTGGGTCFVHINSPDAGKNLQGRWVISPDDLRNRYARLGITDFAGFANLALLHPEQATYLKVKSITGSMGEPLKPWVSIAADFDLIPPGQTCSILFKNKNELAIVKVQDAGSTIKGKHIDIYLGEGEFALNKWQQSGGNRYVDVYLDTDTKILAGN
jgi:3D (Asp-Asp-Asp) domain-containing protein